MVLLDQYTNIHPLYSDLEDGGSMYFRNVSNNAHISMVQWPKSRININGEPPWKPKISIKILDLTQYNSAWYKQLFHQKQQSLMLVPIYIAGTIVYARKWWCNNTCFTLPQVKQAQQLWTLIKTAILWTLHSTQQSVISVSSSYSLQQANTELCLARDNTESDAHCWQEKGSSERRTTRSVFGESSANKNNFVHMIGTSPRLNKTTKDN